MHSDICQAYLWENKGTPLVFLIPGGAGTRRRTMPGYPAMAGFFWLHGWSVYIAATAGQDGQPGVFSMKDCLDECVAKFDTLVPRLSPNSIVLFGACSGGTIATHLAAAQPVDTLVIWETLPRYDRSFIQAWKAKTGAEVAFSDGFLEECLDTVDSAGDVKAHVVNLYGRLPSKTHYLSDDDVQSFKNGFGSAASFTSRGFEGADHNLPRGTNPRLLNDVLTVIISQLGSAEELEKPR